MTDVLSDTQRAELIERYRAQARQAAGVPQGITPEAAQAAQVQAAQQALAASQQAAQPGLGAPPADPGGLLAARLAAGQPVVGDTLPAEDQMNQLMELIRANSEALQAAMARVNQLETQVTATAAGLNAAQGEPYIVRYARGAQAKILSHAIANPDLGTVSQVPTVSPDGRTTVLTSQVTGHFENIAQDAGALVNAAEAAAKGDQAAVGDVQKIAGIVRDWFTRGHGRASNKGIDFSAAADDIETVLEEAARLAVKVVPVAAAVL